jgi:DNA-binding FadR family transcriptional regulator
MSATQAGGPTRPTRSVEIARILRDEILSGQYRAGERLPSERDLSERFIASRSAVREALKALDQLGLASIQRGGARAKAIDSCTLDVLGPLLDLHEIPDPKLVDEVLQLFGILMDTAARACIEKATPEQLDQALGLIDEILASNPGDVRQHEALRRLGEFYIDVADHLVLRLMVNGLRTSFLARMHAIGIRPRLDNAAHILQLQKLREAVLAHDPIAVGTAMKEFNRLFRVSALAALEDTQQSKPRELA